MLAHALDGLLYFGPTAHLRGGFGHFGGLHRAGGIVFGARLLEYCLAAVIVFAVAVMANVTVSDWVRRRYGEERYASLAGWGAFFAVVAVLGLGVARFV